MVALCEGLAGHVLHDGVVLGAQDPAGLVSPLLGQIHRADVLGGDGHIVGHQDGQDGIQIVGQILEVVCPGVGGDSQSRQLSGQQAGVVGTVGGDGGQSGHVAPQGVGDVGQLDPGHLEGFGHRAHHGAQDEVGLSVDEGEAGHTGGGLCSPLALDPLPGPAGEGFSGAGELEHLHEALEDHDDDDRLQVACAGQVGVEIFLEEGHHRHQRVPSVEDGHAQEGADDQGEHRFLGIQCQPDHHDRRDHRYDAIIRFHCLCLL